MRNEERCREVANTKPCGTGNKKNMSVASYTESEEEEEEEEFETDAETEEADTAVSAQTRSKSEKKDNSSPESSGVTDEKPFRRKLLEEEDDTSLGERRSKRTKKMVAPIVPTSSSSSLSSSPSIKGEEEPVKTEMIEEEELLSEDEQPRGRDFDLNQIRSELKGIERAVNISPEDTLLKHTEDKQEPPVKLITEFKEETVMVTKEEYNIPVVTEQTKEPAAFKNIANTSAEDIYEFKEPEPFEFEVRAKRDLSEGRRPIGRIFDEVVPETKVDKSPRKRFGRGKVAIKINSPLEGEMKRRFNRTIGRKIEQATQSGKTVQEIADKPAVTEPTPVPAKPRQLSACEEAFDKLCESPVYHSASKPSPSRCLASDSSAVDISPLSLFSELPGDEEDDCGEDSNDRLVISETEETVAESEGPLFSYPKLFPGLVGSDPPVPKMEETSLDKPPEPPVAESSLFDMTTKLEFETDICKVNVSEECKKEEDDMRGCNSIETSTTMHEDVIKLLLKPGKVVEDYEEDPINAAIQRVIEQSMSDGSNDADIFDENTVMRQPSPVSSSLRQDQTFSPNKEEHSEIDSSVECIKSSPNTELIGDMTVQESAILSPKREPSCVGVLSPRRDIFNRESLSMSSKNELNINMKSPMRETSVSSPKREMTSKDQTENKISSCTHPQSEQSSKKLSPRRPASDESVTDSSDEESRLVIATKPDDDDDDDDEEEEKRVINNCQVEEESNSSSSSECLSLRLRLTSECEDVETTEPPSLVKSPQWETYSDNSAVTGTIEKGTLFCFEKIVKQEGNGKASDSYNIESGNDKSDDDEDEEEDEDGSADITLQNPKRRRLDFEPGSTEKIMENNPGNTDPKTIQKEEEPVCEAVKSPSFDPYADLSLKCEELDIPASPLPESKADLDAEAADNLCSLLCEETIPGSPAPVTEPGQEQETGNKVLEMPFASAVSSNCIPPPATSSTVPVSVGVAVKRGSSEAAPVMDNTPPTTPDSTLSTISDSPREEQERLSPNLDNESSKSHRDSFELDIDSCENKISNSSDARLGKKIEKDAYKKRRHSRKRSESEVIKRIRPNLVSHSPRSDIEVFSTTSTPEESTSRPSSSIPRGIPPSPPQETPLIPPWGTPSNHPWGTKLPSAIVEPAKIASETLEFELRCRIGGDSDDSSENSVDCTPTNSDSVMASSRSPRPSKYNFYVELGWKRKKNPKDKDGKRLQGRQRKKWEEQTTKSVQVREEKRTRVREEEWKQLKEYERLKDRGKRSTQGCTNISMMKGLGTSPHASQSSQLHLQACRAISDPVLRDVQYFHDEGPRDITTFLSELAAAPSVVYPDMDGSQRIALLQHKLQELRKTYINVKAELACIDRRRKKLRRREREGKQPSWFINNPSPVYKAL
uniref:Uncharacterized protein n=1 Tax=Timema monikensis TaxID=170555 RepID=A0A7R9HRT1_9NEOP|nr:unnamed protein product [Timema monikensis]